MLLFQAAGEAPRDAALSAIDDAAREAVLRDLERAGETGQTVTAAAAAQGLALLAFGLAVAPLAVRLARRLHPGRNVFFARWGFSHVALALGLAAALMLSAPLVFRALGWDTPDTVQLVLIQCVLTLPVAASLFGFANALDPEGWRALGLRSGGWGSALAVGVLAYVAALPGMLGLQTVWRFVLEQSPLDFSEQFLVEQARELQGARLWGFAFLAVVVAPFFEELVFRAFLQPLLVQNLGDRGGVAAAAALFALAHANLGASLPIFALGVVLGMVMLRTQRLVAPWIVHALHNGLTLWALTLSAESGSPPIHP